MEDLSTVGIKSLETNTLEIIQSVDNDGDETMGMILFQPRMAAKGESKFEVVTVAPGENPTAEDTVTPGLFPNAPMITPGKTIRFLVAPCPAVLMPG